MSQPPEEKDIIAEERMAADKRWFEATPEKYNQFITLSETPLPSTDRLERLASMPSPFSSE